MGDAYNLPSIFPEMIYCSFLEGYWLKLIMSSSIGVSYGVSNITMSYNADGSFINGSNGYNCKGVSIQTWCSVAGRCR